MPVSPTYPGVYVQEVPSGVRTITGVPTSTTLFIGRAKEGPMFKPKLCTSFEDFKRSFSIDKTQGELPTQVQMFFQNGGVRCYVVRIADGAGPSSIRLETEGDTQTLELTAKSEGLLGDKIRVAVDYNTQYPESTFNLSIFRWHTNALGVTVKENLENFKALSMAPGNARNAADYISKNSELVKATDLAASALGSTPGGFSQSGRPIPVHTHTAFRNEMIGLIGTTSTGATNCFRISVDGGSPVDVDLSSIDFSVAPLATATTAHANLAGEIQTLINDRLAGSATVTVSFQAGPTSASGATEYLRFASANGDVFIEPAAANDAAVALMLGTAQGGLEVSGYASYRPAPTGLFFDLSNLNLFGALAQDAFNQVTVGTQAINLLTALQTSTAPGARMFQDALATTVTNNNDGIREKVDALAKAINDEANNNSAFKWKAERWGVRLALIPGDGNDNSQGSIATANAITPPPGSDISTYFTANVRYYSLGTSGTGTLQSGGVAGLDGSKPTLTNYRTAFTKTEQEVDLFNLLVLPKDANHTETEIKSLWGPASEFCRSQRAFLIMDPPDWTDAQAAVHPSTGVNSLRIGLVKDHSAVFYPRIVIRQQKLEKKIGPCGAIAGLMARIDSTRGVWKAPAGTEASLKSVIGVEKQFSDRENGVMNPEGINTLRLFPQGVVNWGARTMDGADAFGSEYKYIPIRRLALFIEESLYQGLKWVVFEPNDEPLWAQIRLNVGAFMHDLFRKGAFQGQKASDAYFVKCDSETITQSDRNLGIVNIQVGFAPLKPAEFVIIYLQQMAGQLEA